MTHNSESQLSLTRSERELEAILTATTQWQASREVHLITFRPHQVARSLEMMQSSDQTHSQQSDKDAGRTGLEKPLPPVPKLPSSPSFPRTLRSASSSFGSSMMKGARRLSIFNFRTGASKKNYPPAPQARVQVDKGTQTDSQELKKKNRREKLEQKKASDFYGVHDSSADPPGDRTRRIVKYRQDVADHTKKRSQSLWPAADAFPNPPPEDNKLGQCGSSTSLPGKKRDSWTETPSAMLPQEWAYTGPPPWVQHAGQIAAASSVDSIGTYESRYSEPSKHHLSSGQTPVRPSHFARRTFSDSSIALPSTLSSSTSAALGPRRVMIDTKQGTEAVDKSPVARPNEVAAKPRKSISRSMSTLRKRDKPGKVVTENGSAYESPLRRELGVDQIVEPSEQPKTAPAITLHPSSTPSPAAVRYQVYFPAFTPAIETDVPEHFRGSPLCPLHPKNRATTRFCPYHGRLPSSDEMVATPSSIVSSDSGKSRKTNASDSSGVDPFDTGSFRLEVPAHSPNSPMCPANLKYNPNGRGVCVWHGRSNLPNGATESSDDSVPRKDAMMTFTTGS